MNRLILPLVVVMAFGANGALADESAPQCGTNTGEAATGEPIKVGGIHGNAAPGDFSSSTDSAAAYFSCVNANGGIHGRPIEYLVENDQWNPELAGQAASKLLVDEAVVAMVGNGSFLEMAVNAGTYKDADMMVMASACAVSECFESSNIVSTNQGPLGSNVGVIQYMQEELGVQSVACISLAIPNVGTWSCDAVAGYMENNGGSAQSVLLNPAAPDVNSAMLEAIATGADTMLINLPAGLATAVLKAAEEQDLRDAYKWGAPTTLYDLSVPAALGEYWDGHIYVNAELAPFTDGGDDNQNWIKVMDGFANDDDPRDTFSQSGYLSAKFFVETLLKMDANDVGDREKVNNAITAINGYASDLMCGPYYVGEADFHYPNHAGHVVLIKDGSFDVVRDCFEYNSAYFDPHAEIEKQLGLR
ncbi:ABC transporter substrate-binding protein [uncultured Tateyamaria sp.]|uniref:ABC transporter substrate-binding protein n=1 Tax=uncultured Tateyamaria sp. TaxID=455651 RepID=UPI00262F68DC|nr:ABC transporter substrate-binding protein [uncultured Tateyamaria sp.]